MIIKSIHKKTISYQPRKPPYAIFHINLKKHFLHEEFWLLVYLTLYIQEMLTLFIVKINFFRISPSNVELNEAIFQIQQFEERKFAFPLIEAPLTNMQ